MLTQDLLRTILPYPEDAIVCSLSGDFYIHFRTLNKDLVAGLFLGYSNGVWEVYLQQSKRIPPVGFRATLETYPRVLAFLDALQVASTREGFPLTIRS